MDNKEMIYEIIISNAKFVNIKKPIVEHNYLHYGEHCQKVTIVRDNEVKIAEYSGHIEYEIRVEYLSDYRK